MTASDERFPISTNEENALPSMDGVMPEDRPIGEAEDRQHSPRETALAVDDFGTTATEQRDGESLDGRLAREEPDTPVEPYPVDAMRDIGGEREQDAGRLVEADEGARTDTDPDQFATDVGRDRGARTAEEAAMRIVDDAPGGTWSTDDYVNDNGDAQGSDSAQAAGDSADGR